MRVEVKALSSKLSSKQSPVRDGRVAPRALRVRVLPRGGTNLYPSQEALNTHGAT